MARKVKEKAKTLKAVAKTTVANRKESVTNFATLVNVHEETAAITAIPQPTREGIPAVPSLRLAKRHKKNARPLPQAASLLLPRKRKVKEEVKAAINQEKETATRQRKRK